MRSGNHPVMVLTPKAALMCIATGSDATTEHECGSRRLVESLTGSEINKAAVAEQLRKDGTVTYPDLMASKRITRNLSNIAYAEREHFGELQASLVYSADHQLPAFGDAFVDAELRIRLSEESSGLAGAWDDSSFGFRAMGARRVEQLRDFATALKDGKGIFAGTFLDRADGQRLNGVIIAIEDLLRPEHRAPMRVAQATFEAEVRLAARARTSELQQLRMAIPHRQIGFIWPIWKNNVVDGEVVYAMNPGYQVDAEYWGPYDFEQLSEWLKGGASTPLRTRRSSATEQA